MKSKTYTIPIKPPTWNGMAAENVPKFHEKFKQDIRAFVIYLIQQHGDDTLFQGPLQLDATFYIPIAKQINKRSLFKYCHTYPRILDLTRFTLDSIDETEIIWTHSQQVSKCNVEKIFDKDPRTVICISELE